jgi:hypothetical protein
MKEIIGKAQPTKVYNHHISQEMLKAEIKNMVTEVETKANYHLKKREIEVKKFLL